MIKFILFMFTALLSLYARENPFFSANGESIPITSNEKTLNKPLNRVSISLPSTARVIEGITIRYKNLDGSQSEKSMSLENSVDWHHPIYISQDYTKSQKNQTYKRVKKYRKIASLPYISFYGNGKNLKVVTKDKIIRDFFLINPHRIVFDLKRDIDIRSYIKKSIKNSIFTRVRIGNHKGYYRAVVELDGYYSYKLIRKNGYYIFRLR